MDYICLHFGGWKPKQGESWGMSMPWCAGTAPGPHQSLLTHSEQSSQPHECISRSGKSEWEQVDGACMGSSVWGQVPGWHRCVLSDLPKVSCVGRASRRVRKWAKDSWAPVASPCHKTILPLVSIESLGVKEGNRARAFIISQLRGAVLGGREFISEWWYSFLEGRGRKTALHLEKRQGQWEGWKSWMGGRILWGPRGGMSLGALPCCWSRTVCVCTCVGENNLSWLSRDVFAPSSGQPEAPLSPPRILYMTDPSNKNILCFFSMY